MCLTPIPSSEGQNSLISHLYSTQPAFKGMHKPTVLSPGSSVSGRGGRQGDELHGRSVGPGKGLTVCLRGYYFHGEKQSIS